MTLAAGSKLGAYEILGQIGAGGMGEVYRARDTRLGREVAVKVLPEELFEGEEKRKRFEREAKLLASLNHPNIAAVYSFEEILGRHILVMELIDGHTLAERLLKGPVAADQLLRTGIDIASALDAAHRAGIVHRDLKPGNVMLTKSGAKLLDFGLAKAAAPPFQPSDLTSQPTELPRNLTQQGTILGTFQYMAPEQLEGKEADARTDIFAFGAVLYEMATGRKAFEGKSQASLISAIMASEPPAISAIHPMTPPALDRVVRTCLSKDPDERWQNTHDLVNELKWIAEGSQAGTPAAVVSRGKVRARLAWGVAAAFALAAAALAALLVLGRRGTLDLRPIHAQIPIPDGARFGDVAVPEISPDGTMIVWSGAHWEILEPGSLWVRTLANDDARALAGTERATWAFWSPDSRSIGFFADRKLKRIDLVGGAPVTLCDIPDVGRGGTWNQEGVILFSGDRAGPLFRVPATGGVPEPVTKLDASRGDTTHRWPHFLPDGRRFLYLASPNVSEKRAVFVATLDGTENRLLALAPDAVLPAGELGHANRTEAVANATYALGHVFFAQRGALYARPFDPSSAKIVGPAFVVADDVASGFGVIRSMFSASRSGDLVFVAEPTNFGVHVEWVDRVGHRSPALGEDLIYSNPQLSPDGKRLAIVIQDAQSRQADIWTVDLAGGTRTRLTFGPGSSRIPVWSPDGDRIAFRASRPGVEGIFEKPSSGTGAEILLVEVKGAAAGWPTGFGRQSLLYTVWDPSEGTKHDVWAVPFSPQAKPFPYVRTTADEGDARFSPDGRYVAYRATTESGRNEVYVQTFPVGGGRWQVSTGSGANPRWRGDGKELFFRGAGGRIFSAQVRAGATFEVGTSRPVLEALGPVSAYDVTPDGQRLLICSPVVDPAHLPLRLIAHWPAALKR
ncbi:MAG: protein kinase [Acidobacteriota bacterium]